MFTLSSETEKLSYYVLSQGRTQVTREDIHTVSVPELEADTYALANAIMDGNYQAAMDALEVMKFRRVDPIMVLSQVTRTVCDLCDIRALVKEGLRADEIAEVLRPLRMNEYKIKLCMNSAASKSDKRLRRALRLCAEADAALKLSPQGYLAIERLIGSL